MCLDVCSALGCDMHSTSSRQHHLGIARVHQWLLRCQCRELGFLGEQLPHGQLSLPLHLASLGSSAGELQLLGNFLGSDPWVKGEIQKHSQINVFLWA